MPAIDLGVDGTDGVLAAMGDGELIRTGAAMSPPRRLGVWEHKGTRRLALVYDA